MVCKVARADLVFQEKREALELPETKDPQDRLDPL